MATCYLADAAHPLFTAPRCRAVLIFAALLCAGWIAGPVSPPARGADSSQPASFMRDVMPVLSKAGCNRGGCHGNQNGKGGLRLSLRGQDPEFDYWSIVRQHGGRRINRLEPQKSLLLLKPTGRVAHQGGLRFRSDSQLYQMLHRWLADGARPLSPSTPRLTALEVTPRQLVVKLSQSPVALRVLADFSDGSRRDVTDLAVYESNDVRVRVSPLGEVTAAAEVEATVAVRFLHLQAPVRLAFIAARTESIGQLPPATGYVDRFVFAKLKTLQLRPSAIADDTVFVRRAYLDTVGLLPTADEAQRFVLGRDPAKRRQLIDRLLARTEFADVWALRWSDVLRNEEKVLDSRGVDLFHRWIREQFARGVPLDKFASALVSGMGSTYKNPPANFYRANRDPATRGETTARLFLGIRLQCAKCHNHPFDRWTQDDYYQWAAVFSKIDYKIVDNKRRDKFDKNEFNGEQIVIAKNKADWKNARTGKLSKVRLLGQTKLLPEAKPRLESLAAWLTVDNPQFALAQANFIWYSLMGRGLVEPVDDFRLTNPASHPELLQQLAEDFADHRFDVRHLVRVIMNSTTYQLDSRPTPSNQHDQLNYARTEIRRLTAEQLLDAQSQVLQSPAAFAGFSRGLRAGQLPGVRRVRKREKRDTGGDRFLEAFGKPARLLSCACERSNGTTLKQAFMLISGEALNDRLQQPGTRLHRLLGSGMPSAEIVDQLYWAALSRPPTAAEKQAAVKLLSVGSPWADAIRQERLQDLTWALLNCKEFVFRR